MAAHDTIPSSDTDVLPILWNGGRSAIEPGWTLAQTKGGITFCVADANGSVCTPKWVSPEGHLVHVFVTSAYTSQTAGRVSSVYTHDISSSGSTTHTLVSTVSDGPGQWSTSAPFTIGGALGGVTCTSASHVTVDRVVVWGGVVPQNAMDLAEAHNVCGTLGTSADYEMDEGSGKSTKNCASPTTGTLAIGANTTFVLSPFR